MRGSLVDVIVIGSGIAGMSAAKLAAERGLSTTNIESGLFGGLVLNINELDGVPDDEVISGYRLAAKMKMENTRLGIATVSQAVTDLVADGAQITVKTKEGRYGARSVIVASGAQLKPLDVKGEAEFLNRGVSRCADCDGPLFRDQEVAVVGGGDSAVQAALTLAKECRRVYVVHRRHEFRARSHLVEALNARPNIQVLWDSLIEEVVGDESVSGLTLRNTATDQISNIACTGVFAYIGLKPNSLFVPTQVERDSDGYLIVDDKCQTGMPGVFAIGAIRAGFGGLLADARMDAECAVEALRI